MSLGMPKPERLTCTKFISYKIEQRLSSSRFYFSVPFFINSMGFQMERARVYF